MPWQSPVTGSFQKIRTPTYSGFENLARKCCCARREPVGAIRIHLYGAAIHTTFASLTPTYDLRCGNAVDLINRTARA
jgi:hypothetical protein